MENLEEKCSGRTKKWKKIYKKAKKTYKGDKETAAKVASAKDESIKECFDVETNTVPSDVTGKANTVVAFIEKTVSSMLADYEKKGIPPEDYEKYLFSDVRKNLNVKIEDLIKAGAKPELVVDSLSEDEMDALLEQETPTAGGATLTTPTAQAPQDTTTPNQPPASVGNAPQNYKFVDVYVKGEAKPIRLSVQDAAKVIEPYAKAVDPATKKPLFSSSLEALSQGKTEDIVKAFQMVYQKQGKQVEKVTYAEDYSGSLSKFASIVISELVRDNGTVFTEDVINGLFGEGFEKKDTKWLETLFPYTDPVYLRNIINEAVTVLDTFSADLIDRLFPNVDKSYLVHIKSKKGKIKESELAEDKDYSVLLSSLSKEMNRLINHKDRPVKLVRPTATDSYDGYIHVNQYAMYDRYGIVDVMKGITLLRGIQYPIGLSGMLKLLLDRKIIVER